MQTSDPNSLSLDFFDIIATLWKSRFLLLATLIISFIASFSYFSLSNPSPAQTSHINIENQKDSYWTTSIIYYFPLTNIIGNLEYYAYNAINSQEELFNLTLILIVDENENSTHTEYVSVKVDTNVLKVKLRSKSKDRIKLALEAVSLIISKLTREFSSFKVSENINSPIKNNSGKTIKPFYSYTPSQIYNEDVQNKKLITQRKKTSATKKLYLSLFTSLSVFMLVFMLTLIKSFYKKIKTNPYILAKFKPNDP